MYNPSKPTKNAIKIIMICVVSTKYMLDAIPFVGKVHALGPGASNLGYHYTITLCENFFRSGRNIITDNCFTSIQLAKNLLDKGMILLVLYVVTNKMYNLR